VLLPLFYGSLLIVIFFGFGCLLGSFLWFLLCTCIVYTLVLFPCF
jgi:hypothetical protein